MALTLIKGGSQSYVAPAPVPTANTTSPAVATYGPQGAVVAQNGPAILNTNPASLAVYVGIGALVLLVYMRQSLPK